jgi:hypothetical protein
MEQVDRTASGRQADATLTVDLAGDVRALASDQSLTFGRAADLVVDEANRYLHRVLGRFSWHSGWWWVENLGSQVDLEVVGDDGTLARLAARPEGPGAATPLTGRHLVRFEAGGLRYELDVLVEGGAARQPAAPDAEIPGETTSRFGWVELTTDERLLVTALAEPLLRDPGAGPDDLVPNRAIAARLGWSITKFNRKLDYLCTRLTRSGVRGLQGERGVEATNRRWRLVEHGVAARLVTADDLPLLP